VKKAIIFAALVIVLLTPSLVFAQGILEGPLVEACDGLICQFCDLVNLLQRVLNFAIAFTVIVATLMFAYAGILYVTAAANPKQIQKAHGIFSHVFAGFLLVLTAWLIINIILSVLTGRGLTSWTKDIDCVKQPAYQQAPTGQPPGAVTPTKPTPPPVVPGVSLSHDETLKRLTVAGIQVCSSGGDPAKKTCQVYAGCNASGCTSLEGANSTTVTQLINLCNYAGKSSCVITGFTECEPHTDGSRHCDGTAVDLRDTSGFFTSPVVSTARTFFDRAGTGQGRDLCGNKYLDEGDHLHFTFTKICPYHN